MISESDLGWCGGILDFQGHIVHKDNPTRARGSLQITLYVETSITAIVAKLGQLTATSPEDMKTNFRSPDLMRRGCVEHCPEAHVHAVYEGAEMPPQRRWTVSGASCAVVLWNVRDLLVTEKEPWDWALAMTLASTRLTGQGSGTAVQAIRRMAAAGWEMPPLFRDVIAKQERQEDAS
jgi:hypothetical protein